MIVFLIESLLPTCRLAAHHHLLDRVITKFTGTARADSIVAQQSQPNTQRRDALPWDGWEFLELEGNGVQDQPDQPQPSDAAAATDTAFEDSDNEPDVNTRPLAMSMLLNNLYVSVHYLLICDYHGYSMQLHCELLVLNHLCLPFIDGELRVLYSGVG